MTTAALERTSEAAEQNATLPLWVIFPLALFLRTAQGATQFDQHTPSGTYFQGLLLEDASRAWVRDSVAYVAGGQTGTA